MIKLPKSYNYAEAYLTFRCPFICSYCINGKEIKRERKELSADSWIKGLNRIVFGKVPLTLGGGEPTQHKGYYKIINNLKPEIKIDLLTNLSFNLGEFMHKVSPNKFSRSDNPAYKSIRVSYHAKQMDSELLIERVKELQNMGYPVGIFGLNHPDNTQDNIQMSELARKHQVYFFIKDFLGWYNGQLHGTYNYPSALDGRNENVLCKTKELLISPEGDTFKCHRDLYENKHKLNNLLDNNFTIKDRFRRCINFGECNPCDVKLKTNRFLEMGNSSVEIIVKTNDKVKKKMKILGRRFK